MGLHGTISRWWPSMMSSTVKKFCPVCGQKLAMSTTDLAQMVQCPRCQTSHRVGLFVAVNHTLEAVAVPREVSAAAAAPLPIAPAAKPDTEVDLQGQTTVFSPTAIAAAEAAYVESHSMIVSPDITAYAPHGEVDVLDQTTNCSPAATAHACLAPGPFSPRPTLDDASATMVFAGVHAPVAPSWSATPTDGPFPRVASSTAAQSAQVPVRGPFPNVPSPRAHGGADGAAIPTATDSFRNGVAMAADAGRAGVSGVRSIGNLVLDLAESLDTALYGARTTWIVTMAGLGVVLHFLSMKYRWEGWSEACNIAFFCLVFTLALARVAVLRTPEEGRSAWDLVVERVGAAFEDARLVLEDFSQGALHERLRSVSRSLLGFGLIVVETWILLVDVFNVTAPSIVWLYYGGISCLIAGVILGVWRWFATQSLPVARPRVAVLGRVDEAALRTVDPVVLADAYNPQHLAALDPSGGVLAQTLEALVSWTPRRCDYEEVYQTSLERHLRKQFAPARVKREFPLPRPGGRPYRLDLMIEGEAGMVVAIEMKRRLRLDPARKVVRQVRDYADQMKQGPVILVLCDPEEKETPVVCDDIRALHREGRRVLVVLVPVGSNRRRAAQGGRLVGAS